MKFDMRIYIWATIGVLIFIALFYIYQLGRNAEKTKALETVVEETTKAVKDRQNAKRKVSKTDDVDALLIELGIMRSDDDR